MTPGPQTILLIGVVLVCGATDLLFGKIFNAVTLSALVLGLALNGVRGLSGLEAGLLGAAVGFVPLYLVFRLGGMGGGDVKLMAGIGGIMGYPFVVSALFYSILAGGALALILLIRRGVLGRGLVQTCRLLAGLVVPGLRVPDPDLRGRVPFGLAIAAGSLWACVNAYVL